MHVSIRPYNVSLNARLSGLVEKQIRAVSRLARDAVSTRVVLRRNAGRAPRKRFDASARLMAPSGNIHGSGADGHLEVAVRKLVAKLSSQVRRKASRSKAARRVRQSRR
jgi:ribosomal subunit interface protein